MRQVIGVYHNSSSSTFKGAAKITFQDKDLDRLNDNYTYYNFSNQHKSHLLNNRMHLNDVNNNLESISFLNYRVISEKKTHEGSHGALRGALWGIPVGILFGILGQTSKSGGMANKAHKFWRWGIFGFLASTFVGYVVAVQQAKKTPSFQQRLDAIQKQYIV